MMPITRAMVLNDVGALRQVLSDGPYIRSSRVSWFVVTVFFGVLPEGLLAELSPQALTRSSTFESLKLNNRPTRRDGKPFVSTHRQTYNLVSRRCAVTSATQI